MSKNRVEQITIAGNPSSGKSSAVRGVVEIIGFKSYSAGDIARDIAIGHGKTINEMTEWARKDPAIKYDELIDSFIRGKRNETRLVMDSRLGFHWLQDSFKVFLQIDIDIAAQRAYERAQEQMRKNGGNKNKTEHYDSIEEARADIQRRFDADNKYYLEYLNVDYTNPKHFDMIINTGLYKEDEVPVMIVEQFNKFLQNKYRH